MIFTKFMALEKNTEAILEEIGKNRQGLTISDLKTRLKLSVPTIHLHAKILLAQNKIIRRDLGRCHLFYPNITKNGDTNQNIQTKT